jgi:tetratricopeptide (TPR) repeat protein
VGRDDALRVLTEAIGSATRGQALHITGEPGIGKSRLLDEVVRRLAARHSAVIVAPARPDARAMSPSIARIVEGLGGTIDSLRALGLEQDDLRALAGYLGGAAGTPIADERARGAAITSTVRSALALRARGAPLCLVVDDVHLADRLTRQVLASLVAEPIERVTLLLAARPGHELPWRTGDATVRTATLARLSDQEIAQIVAGALLPTRAPRELQEAVVARAGGSPLMTLEVLHAMIDCGVLTSIGERWTVVGDLAGVARPVGLRALYAARIDALPPYARDVLSCAAVVGDESSRELLERIVAKEQGVPIERELRMAVARGWLVEQEGRFRFAEPSAREAIYERLVQATRRELHRAAAGALAATPGSLDDRIGEHYELAGEPARALEFFGRAIDAALRGRELQRAARLLARTRALCRSLTTAAANRRLAEDSLRLAEVMLELGELTDLKTVLAEGLAAAHKDDDASLVAKIRRARGKAAAADSQLDAAIGDLEAALAAAVGLRDRMMIAELHGDLGEVHEKKGDLVKAIDYLLRALELVQTAPGAVQHVVLRLLTALGRVVLRNREIDRAERFLRQALELAEQLDDKAAAAKVLGNVAAVWHARTDYAKALDCANRALALSREIGDLVSIARQLTNIGTLASLAGDVAAAERSYDAAFAQAQRAGWREGMASAAAARERLNSGGTRAR